MNFNLFFKFVLFLSIFNIYTNTYTVNVSEKVIPEIEKRISDQKEITDEKKKEILEIVKEEVDKIDSKYSIKEGRGFNGVYIGAGVGYDRSSLKLSFTDVSIQQPSSTNAFSFNTKIGFGTTFLLDIFYIGLEFGLTYKIPNKTNYLFQDSHGISGLIGINNSTYIDAAIKFGVIFFEKNMLYSIVGISAGIFKTETATHSSDINIKSSYIIPLVKLGLGFERILINSEYMSVSGYFEGFYRIMPIKLKEIDISSFNVNTGINFRF